MNSKAQPLHDLHEFMRQVASEMASEYSRIHARAAEDPGTAGDEGEENWATLFRDWLPPSYHVTTKGRLIGYDGTLSPQIDVLVLKPTYPRKLLEKKIWLAAGVAAVFECKTTLAAVHVRASAQRCASFKSLLPARTGSPRQELRSPLIYGLLSHSHSWKSERSDAVGNIENALFAAASEALHPRNEIDVICVADLAAWTGRYIAGYKASWSDDADELRKAFEFEFGPMTSMICSASSSERQQAGFEPIGALIADLCQRLGADDASVRDIADYYRMVGMWGTGAGRMRPWPITVYSDAVIAKLLAGNGLTNGELWDDWALSGS